MVCGADIVSRMEPHDPNRTQANRSLPGFLLFSGTNDRALIALCRGLDGHKIPFGLIGRGQNDLIKRSGYADRFVLERKGEELVFEEFLHAIHAAKERYGAERWVICPTSEYLNLALFSMRAALRTHQVDIATCDEALYRRISNKSSFREYSTLVQVPPPELLEARSFTDLTLPFVAKPKTNLSRSGKILYPYLVRTLAELERFKCEADFDAFYFEEFVEGESWYLLFYVAQDGKVVHGAQRNYLQQGTGKSIVVAQQKPFPESDVPARYSERLVMDGYRGFIMVEIRRTQVGRSVSIEANPRCWGPLQLTIDGGMGLLEAFLEDHGYSTRSPMKPSIGRYYCWSGGVVQALRTGKGLDRHSSRSSTLWKTLCALPSDVYARSDAWSCFNTDLWHV